MSDLDELVQTLEELENETRFWRFKRFVPYAKQRDFFKLGAAKRERLLMAGNQLGKTEAGAYEMALHLTGLYPSDWVGWRFTRPIKAWGACDTGVNTRDGIQQKLLGPPGVVADQGTGFIPKDFIIDTSLARGVTDYFDTIQVKHFTRGKEDGISTIGFKSYDQGRTKFQGATLDLLWCDEEPPEDVYSECLARITATAGKIYMTFTPLRGKSSVVRRFLDEPSIDRDYTTMVIEDVGHVSKEQRRVIAEGYLPHEREARLHGVPLAGSGRIFTSSETSISEEGIAHQVPAYWRKLWAVDFGIGHPFAAVLLLHDADNDVIHVHHAIRVADQLPLQHAVPMKVVGAGVPVAWPHDGDSREKSSGETLATAYRKQGLLMLPEHATWPDGGYSTEAGILEMQQRMEDGRFKVADHLADWFSEYRDYHRKDGLIVKEYDDLMSATRIGVMAIRKARAVPLGANGGRRHAPNMVNGVEMARDVDFPLS